MKTITTIQELRTTINNWKQKGHSIAFVPTMGNLHQGHLELVKAAKEKADKVVVSIFVNPTQFGENEDFDAYPRTEQQDLALLKKYQADILFLPAVDEIYHPEAKTIVTVKEISDLHCGASRQGHFSGVATVVCKFFNMVQPDFAFFGEKDFQQLTIIRLMVRDLNIPVQIESVAIVRESDGLAMSSRNGYLTNEQRKIAPKLYQSLQTARDAVIGHQASLEEIRQQQRQALTDAGFEVDYFSICRSGDLMAAKESDKELVILAAAKLGKPRLIDNIAFRIS